MIDQEHVDKVSTFVGERSLKVNQFVHLREFIKPHG